MPIRKMFLLVFVTISMAVFMRGTQLHAQTDDQAHQILSLTNADRAEHGLQPLKWDASLASAAVAHTQRMANEKSLSHQYPGEADPSARAAQAGAHFQAMAENTAMGPDPKGIEKEWMNSVPHRTNILDPQMNRIGIAVVEKGGYLYATEDFSNAAESLSRQQVEDKVGELLHGQNIIASQNHEQAEQACAAGQGVPQGIGVKSIVRFQTSDLSQLPSQVADQIKSGQFTKAAVGACSPGGSEGNFTSYRVAILLF
jgi:Cysteine-rich secretory protein family